MEMYGQYQYIEQQMMLLQAMEMQRKDIFCNYMMQPGQLMDQQIPNFIESDEFNYKSRACAKGKRAYVQCELWKRQLLVEKVEKEGMTIKDAAKQLDINYSTAKHIIKVYRQTGETETKIMMKRSKKESSSSIETDASRDVQLSPRRVQNTGISSPHTYFQESVGQQ